MQNSNFKIQNENLKFKIIRLLPVILLLVALGHFIFRKANQRVAGVKDITIDWQTIDPLVSLLPREVYLALPGQTDPYQIVRSASRELYDADRVKMFPDPSLGLGSMISVQRALPVAINDGGEAKVIRTWAKKVGDLLGEQSIEVGEKDQLSPNLETSLTPETRITITRVIETEVKETESIPFATKTRNDPELEKGQTRIEQKGKKGKKAKYYLVRRENGKTVDKKFLRDVVIEEPVEELIIIGTKVVVYGEGKATWFGAPALTAAHNTLPRGTRVRVVNKNNGKEVVVKVIGGGIQRENVLIDLSPDAFKQLAPLSAGVITVRLEKE
jgi:hypothetical protein